MDTKKVREAVLSLASQGREWQTKIRNSKGPERASAWASKRSVGRDARIALLAYAYARGIPYSVVERKTDVKWNDKYNCLTLNLMADILSRWDTYGIQVTEEEVLAWLLRGRGDAEATRSCEERSTTRASDGAGSTRGEGVPGPAPRGRGGLASFVQYVVDTLCG